MIIGEKILTDRATKASPFDGVGGHTVAGKETLKLCKLFKSLPDFPI
jgi:hypothetical protein